MAQRRLGPYRLGRLLGQGAAGRVFLATAPGGARVAVKVFDPPPSDGPEVERRWSDEARIGMRIEHENVVHVLDAGHSRQGDGTLRYLVLEHVEGETLREFLRRAGRIPESLCLDIGQQIARALAAIHGHGVVHRDLKPENVMIAADGTVKVADLGVAAVRDGATRGGSERDAGTLLYAAPEQVRGASDRVDGRADLYSLGVILHELATGRHPFADMSPARVAHAHVSTGVPPLERCGVGASAFFASLVATLAATSSDRRFATTADALDAFERRRASRWWRARGGRSAGGRTDSEAPAARGAEPFVGRRRELAYLCDRLLAARGGRGSMVLVSGDAGVGKSRLIERFLVRGLRRHPGALAMTAAYPPGGQVAASWACVAALRDGLRDDELRAAVRRGLRVERDLGAAFLAMLGGRAAPAGAPALTDQTVETAVTGTLRALAAERLVVVVVEDLHFASTDAVRVLASIAKACADRRLLLVATTRRVADAPCDTADRLDVAPFGRERTHQILSGLLGSDAAAETLLSSVWDASSGNPFAVREIVRDLRDRGVLLRVADGSWTAARAVHEVGVPRRLHDLVGARLARLTRPERDLLAAAAVLGPTFDDQLLAESLGKARSSVRRRLDLVAARSGFVRRAAPSRPSSRGADGRATAFEFEHHQVLESVVASLRPAGLRRAHRAAAEALERRLRAASPDRAPHIAVPLCEHLLTAGLARRAAGRLLESVRHLASTAQFVRCAALVARALEAGETIPDAVRAELIVESAARGPRSERAFDEIAILREAVDLAGRTDDERLACRAAMTLSYRLCFVGRFEGTFDLARGAHRVARRLGDMALRAQALMRLSEAENGRRGPRRTILCARGAVCAARRTGDPDLVASCLINLQEVAARAGDWRREREALAGTAALLPQVRNPMFELRLLHSTALTHSKLERWPESVRAGASGLRRVRRRGEVVPEISFLGALVGPLLRMGRHAAARAAVHRAVALARRTGDPRLAPYAEAVMADLADWHGRLAEALDHWTRCVSLHEGLGDRMMVGYARIGNCRVLAQVGRFDEADAALAATAPSTFGTVFELRWQEASAAVALARGDCAGALAGFRRAVLLSREAGSDIGLVRNELEAVLIEAQGARAPSLGVVHLARTLAVEIEEPALEALALACEVRLGARDPRVAARTVARLEARLGTAARLRVRWHLWSATGDERHIDAASRALRRLVTHAPFEDRTPLLERVAIHRGVLARSRELGQTSATAGAAALVPNA